MRGVRARGMRLDIVRMRFVRVFGMRVRFVRMPGLGVSVGLVRPMGLMFRRDHVDFGCRNAAARNLAHFKTSAHVQRGGGFRKRGEGNAGVNQCAEQHVATNAGETFQISNTH